MPNCRQYLQGRGVPAVDALTNFRSQREFRSRTVFPFKTK